MSPKRKPKLFLCGVCGQRLESDSMAYVMAHAQSHTPEQNIRAVDATFTALVQRIDKTISEWSDYPAKVMDALYESDDCKAMLQGNAKTQDMLAIRLRCAEEFKRVADEYHGLLKARLEVEY